MNQIPVELHVDHRLRDAPCSMRPGLHDEPSQHEPADHWRERSTEAIQVCNACPLHNTCRTVSLAMKPRDRSGIWAGTYWQHNHRNPSRI